MKRLGWLLLLLALLLLPRFALAQERVWTIVTETGEALTQIVYEPQIGDEYIAGDNRLYQIIAVEGNEAVASERGQAALPDVSWVEDVNAAQAVSAMPGEKRLAFYCTHSDESYEPTDGYYSTNDRGSIYLVAQALADALEEKGVACTVSKELHHPHDAGAYRRSRQTAVQLIKAMPDAIFDIHRDGIPNPKEYATTIGGKDVSKIRLLVGRGNQNMEVNKEFALLLKAVADKVYPGLIKDIYMGRGAFNQDLYPQALLLECGTYTLERETVLRSMPMMADVMNRALYGGVVGSAGASKAQGRASAEGEGITPGATDAPTASAENAAAGKGAAWLIGLFAVGLIGFGVIATGSLRGGSQKAARHLSEMTGGLVGKKPEDEEKKK